MSSLLTRYKANPSPAGQAKWEEVFGTTKERDKVALPRAVNPAGGSYALSAVSDNAFKSLLRALRSRAPGGWTDDRWEQTVRHFVGIAYVAIHRICTQLSQAEFQVFQEDDNHPDGKRAVTKNDPPQGDRFMQPYDLVRLLKRPNRLDSFGKLMYRYGQQKYLTGTHLTMMVPNQLGCPHELFSIPTAMAIPQATTAPEFPEGYYRLQPIYPYGPFSTYPSPTTNVGAPIGAQWFIRSMFPHPLLRYEGYSPQTALRLHLDEIEAIDRSRWYTTHKAMRPSAVLNLKELEGLTQGLPYEEVMRIHAEWENEQSTPENHGKLIIGYPGGTFEQWGANPIDMDYPEGWSQLVSFCLGGFGITKPAAGMIEDSSYASLYATLKQLNLLTTKPDCDDFASDLTLHLAPFFGDDLIVEIRCPKIDDHDIMFEKCRALVGAKAIKKNELRKMLDVPVTNEPWGEEFAGDDPQQQALEEKKIEAMAQNKEKPEEERAEPKEISQTQPKPGALSVGALGPRDAKSLTLYNRIRSLLANGNRNGKPHS